MNNDCTPTPLTQSDGESVRFTRMVDTRPLEDAVREAAANSPLVRKARQLRRDHDAWRAEALRLRAEVAALRQAEAEAREAWMDANLREVEEALLHRATLTGGHDAQGREYADRLATQMLARLPEGWDVADVLGEDGSS